MSNIALNIEGLSKTYPGQIEALKNISLKVESGDFYALLGPNGAGKSTAIGIISSLVTKTSGLVEILGIDIDENHSLAKKKLGVVGQEVNINQFETVYQVLSHQAGYYGLSSKEGFEILVGRWQSKDTFESRAINKALVTTMGLCRY